MALLEKITANMESIELKKFKLQKAILTLMLEWQHLEEYMNSTQQSFQDCFDELQNKEKHLNFAQESVLESNKELESARNSFEQRIKELEDKEKEFKAFRDDQVKELSLIGKSVEERIKCVILREEKVKVLGESLEKRIHEVMKSKEIQLEKRSQELDRLRDWIERRVNELDAKEEDFDKRLKELETIEKELSNREIEAMEKQISDVGPSYANKELESIEKEHSNREIEATEKRFSDVGPSYANKELEFEENLVNPSTDLHCFVNMDGKCLQSYLNGLKKDHDLMSEEVYRGLQLLPDPAKIVLDAMEGFYKTDPINGEINVVRRSCILLLEQLLKISPQVKPHVRAEAMELAWQWKAKLSKKPGSLEVLGHLYLSASYGLSTLFDVDDLFRLFKIVANCRQATSLCRILGFTDRVPDLVRYLFKKKPHLAVRFISEFGLVDKFPPKLLVKYFGKKTRKIVEKAGRSKSCNVQQIIDEKVASMQEVLRYIIDHKLESKYSPKDIEKCIEQLLRQQKYIKVSASPSLSKPIEQENNGTKSLPVLTKPGPVSDMAFVLSKMDGSTLQCFLNEHFEDHEVLRDIVLLALQKSSDPGRLVLDAMQGFHLEKVRDEHLEVKVVRSSCILLLEQLMRLHRDLQPQVRDEAMVCAHQLESSIRNEIEDPQMILGFFQFICAFGLTPCFDSDELLRLFEIIAPHPHARELCQVLVFSGKKPGCVLHSSIDSEGSSLESPAHDLIASGVQMEGTSEVPTFSKLSDPARLVLDAIRRCYHSILKNGVNNFKSNLMDKFSSLLEHLQEASPDINSQVQEEAMAFSVDWKSKLSVSRANQAEAKALLHFLATYKLNSAVMFEVLHGFLMTVSGLKNKFALYRQLNFAPKTPDFIEYLIENDERLIAIKFIFEFKHVDKFPPDPILKSHLCYIEKLCTKICEEGHYSPKALDKAANREVALLGEVIGCMSTHRTEGDLTLINLKERIHQIKKMKEDRKVSLQTDDPMAQKMGAYMKKRTVDFVSQPEQQGEKRPKPNTPIANNQSVVPLTNQLVSYHTQAPQNPYGPATGQSRPYSPFPYGYGGMTPLGFWHYNIIPNAGAYHGVSTIVIPRPPAPQQRPPNVISGPPTPQPRRSNVIPGQPATHPRPPNMILGPPAPQPRPPNMISGPLAPQPRPSNVISRPPTPQPKPPNVFPGPPAPQPRPPNVFPRPLAPQPPPPLNAIPRPPAPQPRPLNAIPRPPATSANTT